MLSNIDQILREILEEAKLSNKLSLRQIKLLDEILITDKAMALEVREIRNIATSSMGYLSQIVALLSPPAVTGGILFQQGNPMALLPIAPGNSPQFQVTPEPAGVATLAAQTVWTSSDTTNAPVTINSADPTGLTATVNLPSTAVVGTTFTLTWTYTNADTTTAVATLNLTIVAPNVTGGTIAQIV